MASIINTKGVDISYANGNINLSKVKNAGYKWVMIRCGFGNNQTDQDDKQFVSNVAKAEELGMPWGVYLFSYACSTTDAKSELAHIDRLLKAERAKGHYPTLPIALDMEYSDYVKNNGGWNSKNLTNVATIILDGLKSLGYYPMIYTGYSELAMLNDHIRNDYDCWFAQWNTKPNSYKYNRLGMWQYGGETNYLESNSIAGVGVIDKNIVYKDYPTIIKNGGYNGFKKTTITTTQTNKSASTTTVASTNKSNYSAESVVGLAKAELGYKEKASNSQLNSKTANAGNANYNKYADYIDNNCPDFYNTKKNGYDWCDIFVDYLHIIASGSAEAAMKGLYQPSKSTGAGCIYSAQFYRNNNAWTNGGGIPKIGDQIFFGTKGNEYHTGVVIAVDKNYVYTIEGNSSEMVAERQYSLKDPNISGYGHPNYTNKTTATSSNATPTTSTANDVPMSIYRVRTGGKWLPEVFNLGDYAGIAGKPITDVMVKFKKGTVKYRVHVKGGNWLPYVTGYNTKDDNNGYAGNGKPIDAIEIYYNTPNDLVKSKGYYKAKYRVSPTGGNYYDWQYDNETTHGQDGYAGAFGRTIDRFQIILSK